MEEVVRLIEKQPMGIQTCSSVASHAHDYLPRDLLPIFDHNIPDAPLRIELCYKADIRAFNDADVVDNMRMMAQFPDFHEFSNFRRGGGDSNKRRTLASMPR